VILWCLGKVKVGILCRAMWAMPVSHGLCHSMIVSITLFICGCLQLRSLSFPVKGLFPSGFPGMPSPSFCVAPCESIPCYLNSRLEAEE